MQVLNVGLSFSCNGSDKLCLVIYVGSVGGLRFGLCQVFKIGAVSFSEVFGRFCFVAWQRSQLIMALIIQRFGKSCFWSLLKIKLCVKLGRVGGLVFFQPSFW